MKSITLHFQLHQPWRLKKYRFFNIGNDHNYLDDRLNRSIIERMASTCYLPLNAILLSLITAAKGAFRCSFSISGVAVEQFRIYAPEVLNSFRALARTGCVEFVAESYSHSLSSLCGGSEFEDDVRRHVALMEQEFGYCSRTLCNTELLYNDVVGDRVSRMGFDTMIADGSCELLEWRSANYLYSNSINNDLKLILRNGALSDDFANHRLFVPDLVNQHGELINLFVDMNNFNSATAFDSVRSTVAAILESDELSFDSISEASSRLRSVASVSSPHLISLRGSGVVDLLGNELQDESFVKMHAMYSSVSQLDSADFSNAWSILRSSDHLYYMATKWLTASTADSSSAGGIRLENPYTTSYEAFINFMNILSDFEIELSRAAEAKRESECDQEQNSIAGVTSAKSSAEKVRAKRVRRSPKSENVALL
ncbi:MAG: alpha-amylase [Rikenellaceae bacterium]